MARILSVLGTLAATGALALGVSTPALAAHGQLIVPGQVFDNPSGCVAGPIWPQIVTNNTNEYAIIYDGPNCTGRVLEVVPPGGQSSGLASEFGQSIWIA
ncbi:hypothetical protein ABXV03_01240 [Streptomyces harbinensis]|uniref:hypothetical protein n=1 Tax=Streptomyces harbinensis TaxID=1176198 RepID=UPI0033999292